jgi:hypothetical protein
MAMEDAKLHNKDIYVMYADFEGAFNAADHRIMFKHMRQLGMPPTFANTWEHLYGVSSTAYITPHGPTLSIDINRGTLQGDTLSPFLFTLFHEPFLRWLIVGSRGYRPGPLATNVNPTEPITTYLGHNFADDLSLATGSTPNMAIQLRKLSLFSAYTGITVNIRKFCITGALWRAGNALSLANIALLASHLQTQFITINSIPTPIPYTGPTDTYRVLGVELNTSLTFTKHWHELRRTIASLITALSTSPLTQSRKIRVIRGLLIGQHFTLKVGLFTDSQLDILEGQICRALRSAVSSVSNIPRSALHRPTSDLGYGLPSLETHATQLAVCHLHKIMNNPGYRGHMAQAHIRTISTPYSHWPTESIMSGRSTPPTVKCLVRAERDAGTLFHNIPPLSLTNHIASTLRAHFISQDNTLLASLRDKATHQRP